MSTAAVTPKRSGASPQQMNNQARAALLSQALNMRQQIYSGTVYPPANPVLNVPLRNVGLVKRLYVEIVATLTAGASNVNLTDFGLSNLLQQVSFVDLNNFTRIQTLGLHLSLLSTLKRRRPWAGVTPFNTTNGNNQSSMLNVPTASWGVYQAPATIDANDAGTCRAVFEVPLAYSDDDLRGAIYANVYNATLNLQLTFNQNAIVSDAVDGTYAVYQSATANAGAFTSANVTVYQEYLDQFNPALLKAMQIDLGTIYELKNTNFAAITAGQDFPIPYPNFRDFVSTIAIYNNNGTTAGREYGGDLNYISLQAANTLNIWKDDPLLRVQLGTRDVIPSELPAGTYYMSTRKKTISTQQFGNMQLILNAIDASAGAYAQVLWEDFALSNTITGAASLSAS
jgi:P3 major capsid protein